MLVVARPHEWAATLKRLISLGCNVPEATAAGRLVALDAATTLASFSSCCANPAGLKIYGEMVDILAAQGDYAAAEQLEGLWNELAAECPFTLLCGYASANFADPRTASALQAICRSHSHASVKPTELLGAWLLSGRHPRFHLSNA